MLVCVLAFGLPGPSSAQEPMGRSAHEVTVELPPCDPANPAVAIIRSNQGWAALSDPAKRVFCVAPGDYSAAGPIRLVSVSGSAAEPRVIRRLESELHPVDQAQEDRVVIQALSLKRADHWIIDGLTIQDSPPYTNWVQDSSHNVLNRLLVERSQGPFDIKSIDGISAHNVLQNSVLRENAVIPGRDVNCLNLRAPQQPGLEARGNKVLNNEIYDCTDALQLQIQESGVPTGTMPGTIIDENDFYLTSAMYSDCEGNMDPQGACACAEVGLDLKIGGSGRGLADAVVVTNNRMWGFRPTGTCGGSGQNGEIVSVSGTVKYVLIRGNVLFDAGRGIHLANAASHVSIIGNTIVDIRGGRYETLGIGLGPYSEAHGNTVSRVDGPWAVVVGPAELRCNVVLDSGGAVTRETGTPVADYNAYYGTPPYSRPGANDIVKSNAADSGNERYCVWTRRWTGPKRVCFPRVAPTPGSPHAEFCDSWTGSAVGMSIVDEGGPPRRPILGDAGLP